jgi:hypothetical protein
MGETAPGGEPLWIIPKRSRDILPAAKKAKYGFEQAAPANYCTRCFAHRSVRKINPFNGPTHLTRVETFAGAACLTNFAVMQRAETNIVGSCWCDPKRLPSWPRITLGLLPASNRSTVAVETPDQHSLGVVE